MPPFALVLAGAPLDTGNRGVEALGRSALDAIDLFARDSGEAVSTIVLDNGWGLRADAEPQWRHGTVTFAGVRSTRRLHRPESWAHIATAQRLWPRANPVARGIGRATALLDISGGDSFTDLYGPERLTMVSQPKLAALRAGTPLILLPQTYGPFRTERGRELAVRLVRSSALAYARDPRSHARLLDLAGPDADPGRCRSSVDVAFGLRPRTPPAEAALTTLRATDSPLAGVNVSGLLASSEAPERFGLAGDYLATMTQVVRELVADGADVVLIPHVHVGSAGGESDIVAIERVLAQLSPTERSRTRVLPPRLNASELKWCLAQLDWMVGSRMHATIGSLSSGVATFGYAYSDKTRGVFETCECGDNVADARETAGAEAVAAMIASYRNRVRIQATLAPVVAGIVRQAREDMGTLLTQVASWAAGEPAGTVS